MKLRKFSANKPAAHLPVSIEDIKSYSPIGYEAHVVPPLVIYIYDEIGPEVDYVDFVHALRYAPEGQEITIHINSPGGNLNSCLSIINAIDASAANITTVVDGEAASAAAMIWLSGHNKIIASTHVCVMLHGASTGFGHAKTADIKNSTTATERIVESLLDDLTEGFLTDDERSDIRKGVDVYLTGSDIVARIITDDSDEVDPNTEIE
jgi:ATP-dependent protease ClpP protease subunit